MRYLIGIFIFMMAHPVYAAEPVPGGACTAAGATTASAGSGTGHFMICESGTWKSIYSYNASGAFTKLGNQSCASGEILKFNGTVWTCATDASGTGGFTALTGDVTASGTGPVAATIANNAVTIAKLSATGTANNTTYLRGDGTWAGISPGLPGLASAAVWVGNASNTATAVAMSGDATLSNAGVLTIAGNAVTSAKIADGAVTAAKTAIVGTLTEGKWCSVLSGKIVCTSDAPSGGGGGVGTPISGQTFLSSGTWTKPANFSYAIIHLWGGGGGGGDCSGYYECVGGKGGPGGYTKLVVTAAGLGAVTSVSVTVGAGGAVTGGVGGTGGTTSFGSFGTATGGTGGAAPVCNYCDGANGASGGGTGGFTASAPSGSTTPVFTSGNRGIGGNGAGTHGDVIYTKTAGGAGLVIVESYSP